MMHAALERLVEAARALPGQPGGGLPRAEPPLEATSPSTSASAAIAPEELRRCVGALLAELAARTDEALPRVLRFAGSAWDQVDSLALLDAPLRGELKRLRLAARARATEADPQRRAGGLAAQLTLDAALGLVSLLERRLATLVRLKLRSASPALLDDRGRPFLDAAAALAEVAREWS